MEMPWSRPKYFQNLEISSRQFDDSNLTAPGRFIAYFIQRLESPRLRDLRIQIEGSKGCTPWLVLTITIIRLNREDPLKNVELSLKNRQPSTRMLPVLVQTPKVTLPSPTFSF